MRLAVAALAAATLPVAPVAATPTIDVPDVRRHVTGTAVVHVLATNRAVYRVEVATSVVNAQGTTAYSWLEIAVARCAKGTCATPVRYFSPLPATTYQASDLKSVTVTLSAFGKPFVVRWTGPGPSGDLDNEAAVVGTSLDTRSAWAALARVTVLGVTCVDTKAVAARHTTLYPTGFTEPTGMVPLPPKAPAGQPSAARSCRPGPA